MNWHKFVLIQIWHPDTDHIWKKAPSYRRNDPTEDWTCWGRNLQEESNSDTPRRPLHTEGCYLLKELMQSDRKQTVKIGDSLSSFLTCSAGVPQGSILGPVLFSLYVNNLPDVCRNIKMQLYADDAVLYCHASSIQEAAAILSGAMVPVSHWLQNCCLHLNAKKNCLYVVLPTANRGTATISHGGWRETWGGWTF